jgi:diguanylate cyclase (GGDEF)-like protein
MVVPDDSEFLRGGPDQAQSLLRLAETDRRKAAEFLSTMYRDDLTGALLRRPGRQQLEAAVSRSRVASTPLYILFFDVDGLKAVNDRDGHSRGDKVLAATGRALHTALRSDDVIVRYGGDEFVCALTAMTQADATAAIDRVQQTLGRLAPEVELSAGSALVEASDSLDEAIERADADLYSHRRRRRSHDAPADVLVIADEPDPHRVTAAIICGACGGQILLSEFVLVSHYRMTRRATCPACGGTTLILLAAEGHREKLTRDAARDRHN